LNPEDQPENEVRFGAAVELKTLNGARKGTIRKFRIVGVDEASVKDGKIAFVAPIARAVVGKRVGEVAEFRLAGNSEQLEVLNIRY
ncbi:MAG: GreA/GreB family elongation factor, partial [Owenweeksia sp.]